jgi:EAL and modified HD-GYP domain-containing signal transduction protein
MPIGLDSRKAVSVARQPILDHAGHIFGYELLYRGGAETSNGDSSHDLAGARVLTDAVLGVGLDALTCGLKAFVNLTHHLLIDGAGTLLPPETTVLQLADNLPVSEEVIETCQRLHDAGYAIALSNFTPGSPAEALLPWTRFVKVDVQRTPSTSWRALVNGLRPRNVRMIAEGVESAEMATAARMSGFQLFQGFYFCKPTTFAKTPLPARRLAYLNLLAALNRDNLSLEEVENLVKHDLSLSYRVLRSVNSAAFGLHQEVSSIRRALVLLGVAQVRKWASVWSLAGLSEGGTPETVSMALVRARCCELVGESKAGPDSGAYFLLGMCSLLDVILRQPMKDALADMPLPASIGSALMGVPNEARAVLDMVIAYEQGSWDEAAAAATRAGISGATLPSIYADALRWTRELSRLAQTA